MRCAIVEADTRDEVMRECEERMRSIEVMYTRRIMSEVERNEMKTDAKIDMLHRSGMFGARQPRMSEDTIDEGESILSVVSSALLLFSRCN